MLVEMITMNHDKLAIGFPFNITNSCWLTLSPEKKQAVQEPIDCQIHERNSSLPLHDGNAICCDTPRPAPAKSELPEALKILSCWQS